MTPRISVIVTAHDRREHVHDAVASVVRQSIDRSAFEIIVVKNFLDTELDRELERLGARLVHETAPPVGTKLRRGIEASSGEFLAVLEDDDLFEPEKLRYVIAWLDRFPEVGFLRHGFLPIDAQGRPLRTSPLWQKRGRLGHGQLRLGPFRSSWGTLRLVGLYPDFNVSSIVVRRSVVVPYLASLDRIELVPDVFLFFTAILQHCALLIDATPLTRLRLHPGGASAHVGDDPAAALERMRRYSERNRTSFEELVRLARASGSEVALRLAEELRETEAVLLLFREGGLDRRHAAEHLLALLSRSDTYYFWSRVGVLSATIGSLLSPKWVRRLYLRAKREGY
jgi:glycosyltransferase involved in cell wall biosynthesis